MPVVVAFVSQKGGVGKTTLARALASVAAHGGMTVAISDLDVRQQTATRWGELRQKQDLEPAIAIQVCNDIVEALEIFAHVDLLIVDCAGSAHRGTLDVVANSHLVVLPTGASLDDLHPTVLLLHELVAAGIPLDRLTTALCRVLSKAEEDEGRIYLQKAGYDVLPGSIPERAAFREAQNLGHSLNETKQKALAAVVDALMNALLAKVMEQVSGHVSQASDSARSRRKNFR